MYAAIPGRLQAASEREGLRAGGAADLDEFFALLLAYPGEEALHAGLVAEPFEGAQLAGEAGVVVEDVDLAMAGRADLGRGSVLTFLLPGDEVVDGQTLDVALTKLAPHARFNGERRLLLPERPPREA